MAAKTIEAQTSFQYDGVFYLDPLPLCIQVHCVSPYSRHIPDGLEDVSHWALAGVPVKPR